MKEKNIDQKLRPCYLLKNRYLTGDLLCEGEYSRIYRAYDTALDQEVTLKEFTGTDSDSECADTESFIAEAGNFFGKYEYRGTAEVTDVFRDGDHAYIAMEHLPGQNLRQYLHSRKKGQLTIEEAWELLFPVLEFLSWMHSIGIVHGGITMERLVFDENGILCLTGIGDSFLRSRKLEEAGPWSDVRSVSEVLYECLTGKYPRRAEHLRRKGRVSPISRRATVSTRVDHTLRHEIEADAGEGSFGLYALAEQLGMKSEPLAVCLGAVRSVWGEKWLDLTEKKQREPEKRRGMNAFMTRKQRKVTGILCGLMLLAGDIAFGYVHTHERQILEYQIDRDHIKYQKEPVFLMAAETKEAEEILKAAQKEGTLDEGSIASEMTYHVDPKFLEVRKLAGNEARGFFIQDIHLKKLTEEVLGISLKEKSSSRESSVTRYGEQLTYLEIHNQKNVTYVCAEEEKRLEIVSDGQSGRVNSCKVTLSEDEMKTFLKEIFPQIVPETYFTEQEIETVFALAEESMYYSVRYGSFYMSLQKDLSYMEEDAQKCWRLELSSYASEAEDEEQAAGSYARTSAQYQHFMDFVEQNAVESEKDGLQTVYRLEEEDVQKWNQPSNILLLKKTRKDFMKILESQDSTFELVSESDLFKVTDSGIGAVKTQFLREQFFEGPKGEKIRIQYDIISERIYKINLFSEGNKNNWDCNLAAELTAAFSEDCSMSVQMLAEDIQKIHSGLQGLSAQGYIYTDLDGLILMDEDNASQFVIVRSAFWTSRNYILSETCRSQNGEN